LKHETTGDELPSENNGEHAEAASALMEDNKEMFDGEQPGDSSASVGELNLDHEDGNAPVNGENSEDIQNDVVPHDSSESASELESNDRAVSHGEVAEFNATDYAEAEQTSSADNVAEGAETEERVSDEHSDLHDAGPCEPAGEVTDDAPDTDVVDALSPMDVDAAQPAGTEIATPDAGSDGAMEVEYATGAEDASTGLVPYSSGSEKDGESPMAEDKDEISQQSYHESEEKISGDLQNSENIISQTDVSEISGDLQDTGSENIAGQRDVLSAAEYDEVDALQSKVEVSEHSQDLSESGNADGLVEGDDYTVELQPETSEQDLAGEVDQPVSESEVAEKAGIESDMLTTGEADKTSGDASTAPPISSDSVCMRLSSI